MYRLVFGVSVILIAYLYTRFVPSVFNNIDVTKQNILDAWQKEISEPVRSFRSATVGINTNVDVIVRGTDLLRKLKLAPTKGSDHDILNSLEELQQTFSFYFEKGAAVEKTFSNKEVFAKLIKAAEESNETEWFVGGNAALMAQKIVSSFPDTKVKLIGPIGERLLPLLNTAIEIPKSSLGTKDEYHLIMEYQVSEPWGRAVAPVATRFITSYDEANSKASSLETFFKEVRKNPPELVILSGLHMLDGQAAEIWQPRINLIQKELAKVAKTLPVHLELASMANSDLMSKILEQVVEGVNSLGLNEQELAFASFVLGGPHKDLHGSGKQPDIHKVADIMIWILKTFGHSSERSNSKLTRVHFHSLRFHIIATIPGHWENSYSAVGAGTQIAGKQACDTDTIEPHQVKILIPGAFKLHDSLEEHVFRAQEPIVKYSVEGLEFVFSPVLVCKQPLKTVGLGDAISATGLFYSAFNAKI